MRSPSIIVSILTVATLLVYSQTAGFDLLTFEPTDFEFVGYDDEEYVLDDPHVVTGLTAENVEWAFRTTYFSNWHPLTWLSYMVDADIHRPERGSMRDAAPGFHLTNVLLHLANVLLLFFVLRQLTGADWRSGAAAALFAVHPLHVESVAWVAERKDVLCVLFGLLAISAYVLFVRRNRRRWYAVSLVMFAASLMSKQMLVTLPCVLLLLDWWPLRRLAGWSPEASGERDVSAEVGKRSISIAQVTLRRALLEKLPFLGMSIAASIVIVIAQRASGALRSMEQQALGERILNAILAYGLYLWKLVYPTGLAVFYPHPGPNISIPFVVLSAVVLAILTGVCVWLRRRQPYLLVGWLWFLGTLVPVIGLVQVGLQQMADRYMYFPAIGLYLAVVWSAARWGGKLLDSVPALRVPVAVGAVGVYVVLVLLAWLQTGYWQNTETLFVHALAVTEPSVVAHTNLAAYYEQKVSSDSTPQSAREDLERSIHHNTQALELDPNLYKPRYNLGVTHLKLGDYDEALRWFESAARMNPNAPDLLVNWGNTFRLLASVGRMPVKEANERAVEKFRAALRSAPDFPRAHLNLGTVLLERGRNAEAAEHFHKTLEAAPQMWEAHQQMMIALVRLGRVRDAYRHAVEANRLNPALPDPRQMLLQARGPDSQ